jgi:2-keto-3-deoxy-L-rhamnonate aldolase RhmA
VSPSAASKITNVARERLVRGEVSLGFGVRTARSVEIAKAMKTAGFDWLFLDLEHSAMSIETAAQLAIAGLDAGIAPIVRVPKGEHSLATRLLDSGALGIVVPHVDTAAEAREIADALRYPPQGHRGVFSSMPHFDYRGVKVDEMTAALNAANLIVVMLETPAAIDNAEAIAAVDGIDVLLIGTNDLCIEMGIPGELGHAKVADAYAAVVAACRRHRKWPGMGGVYDEPLMRRYVDLGCRFLMAGADLAFMMGAGAKRTEFLRGIAL